GYCGRDSNYDSVYSATVDKYTKDGVHSMLENLSVARSGLAAATDGNGNVLFGGGSNGNSCDNVDKYTKDGVHSMGEDLSQKRAKVAAATDGGGNVLFGGGYFNERDTTKYSGAVDKYTPGKPELPLYAPIGSKFKEAGGVEQVFTSNKQIVKSPFNGYVKFKKGDINYV
ncbi:MAG: hypothetical protein RR327_06895, partial [Clostridia bacterium]